MDDSPLISLPFPVPFSAWVTSDEFLEFRFEAQNALNQPQFVQVPQRDIVNTPPGRFLNRDFTDGGIRSMWLQVRALIEGACEVSRVRGAVHCL